MAMAFDDYLDALREQAVLFAAAVARTPRDVVVASCPDWRIVDLADHLGNVWRFWTEVVLAADPSCRPELEDSPPPEGAELDWLAPLAPALETALRAAGPQTRVWTWWGEPATAAAVARHQMQEAAVHRYDAERAAGEANPLPVHVALDGIEEFLAVSVGSEDLLWPGPAAVLTLAPDESEQRFAVRLDKTVTVIEAVTQTPFGRGPGTSSTGGSEAAGVDILVTVAGTASNLLLALYERVTLADLVVTGDSAVANAFFGLTEND